MKKEREKIYLIRSTQRTHFPYTKVTIQNPNRHKMPFFRVGGFNQLVRDSSQMEYTKCHQLTKSTLFNTIQLIQFWPTHAENVYNPTEFIWVLTVSKYNGRNVDGTNGTQQSEQHIKRDTKRY